MAFRVTLQVPDWLNVKKQVVPDFVTRDPKKSPVWEISGAEFSKADIHTAGGISIRFPRITNFRDDKNWQNATDLPRLKVRDKLHVCEIQKVFFKYPHCMVH